MKRITLAGGMESDDDSEFDDIVFPDSAPPASYKAEESISSRETYNKKEHFKAGSIQDVNSNDAIEKSTKLFVGQLPQECTENELKTLFSQYGTVKECNVLKGYSFVLMSTSEEAENAIKALNNFLLRGSSLKVKVANGHQRRSESYNQRSRGVSYQRQKPRNFSSRTTQNNSHFQNRTGNSNYKRDSGFRQCVDTESSELFDDLRYAVTTGNLETTRNILSKGIYVDTILKAGWTSLMYASSSGHSSVVQYLLENRADPNYHRDMYTPLMAVCASRKNEEDLLKCCLLLLQYGANVNAHERHFTTPLMFAAREGYYNIVKELLNHGADPNLQDNRGKTALALAASAGHGHLIRLLIEKEANPKICDNMGQSPEDLAYESGHNEIVSFLQKSDTLKDSTESADSSVTIAVKKPNGTLEAPPHMSVKTKTYSKVGELELFLSGIGFSEFIETFQKQDLTFHDLLIMDEDELEKIGITQVGVRKKILEACKSVHKKEWQNSSLPNLKQRQYISCPDAVAMMANIAKHLRFISTTVIYIRQQIQSEPRILELAQDSSNVYDLIDEMNDNLKNIHFLNEEMRFLKLHLEKVQDRKKNMPGDFIVETVPKSSERKTFYITFSVATTAAVVLCVGYLWKNPSYLDSIPTFIRLKLPFLK